MDWIYCLHLWYFLYDSFLYINCLLCYMFYSIIDDLNLPSTSGSTRNCIRDTNGEMSGSASSSGNRDASNESVPSR